MKKQNIIILAVAIALFTLAYIPVQAQGPPPPVSSAPDSIDGGISILLAGILIYGYFKLRNNETIAE